MKNSLLLILALFVSFSNLLAQPTKQLPVKKNQPNIIFILTDDLGYGDIGVFYQKLREKNNDRSEPWAFTPNLDKFAEEGAKLTNHYTSAPVCAPARASILTGLHQGHVNVRDNQFDKALEDNYTLGNVLQKAGYSTAAIGKWGLQGDPYWDVNGKEWPAVPLNRGFDYFYGYMRHSDGHEHYPKEAPYREPKEVYENGKEISQTLDKCYTGDLWTAAAKRYIVDHKKGKDAAKPFFIYLAYDTPHAVLELPTGPYPAGGGLNGGVQWIGKPGKMINTATGKIDSWMHPDYANATYDHDNNLATAEVPWPDTYKRYAASTRRIDDEVGDLKQLLVDLKIDDNTIVVFMSDNGPSLEAYLPDSYVPYTPNFFNSFGPFDGVKRDCWEGGIRSPALITWPARIPAKSIINTPNASYDWLATFCDAAGYPAPASTDGVSLIPSLTGKGKQEKSLIYVEYFQDGTTPKFDEFESKHKGHKRNQMQVIRFDDYLGVRYDIKKQSDNFEIYNINKDPKQAINLGNKREMKSLQQKMKDKVLQVRMPDTAAKRPYDNELIPSVLVNKAMPGTKWQAFAGNFPWIPQKNGLTVIAQGYLPTPLTNAYSFKGDGVICYSGYLKIPADGEYIFSLAAHNSFLFRIHEAKVIDADYHYKVGSEQKGTVKLKAGMHPFSIYVKNPKGKSKLPMLNWQTAGIVKQSVPTKVFYR